MIAQKRVSGVYLRTRPALPPARRPFGTHPPMTTTPQARLADYREEDGAIHFRIAHSPDPAETAAELKRRIPTWARSYDPKEREWSIRAEYRETLREVFFNAPVGPAPARRSRRVHTLDSRRGQAAWVVLTLLVIVIGGAALWARPLLFNRASQAAEPTATIDSAGAPDALSATPGVSALQGRITAAANLREGPGTAFAVRAQAGAGDEVTAVGRTRGDDNYWWLRLESGTWVRSDLVVSTDAGELPLQVGLLPELPADGGDTPTAAAEALDAPGVQDDGRVEATVTWVTDGDTIHVMIAGREHRIRYIGIDAPEREDADYEEAAAANRALVAGQTVLLEKDVTESDDYDRLLRYVYLPDGTMVQERLLRDGWGVSTYIPPDLRHRERLAAAEAEAQQAKRGIWAQ